MTGQFRVCVIGAGAAGLCAARHLAARSLIPTVFEHSDVVGGTWVYNEKTGVDDHGQPIHSSMYSSLKTNLPKEVMAFPDFPFPEQKHKSFLHHTEVRQYLESYTDHFDIRRFIKFNSAIRHVKQNDNNKWHVVFEDVRSKTRQTADFEAVMVCNGHYSVPSIPNLKGLDDFHGLKMHSHDYRKPDQFVGKRVLVLGAAASGSDIGLELASAAKHVYLSHNNPSLPSELPSNMEQVAGATEVIGSDSLKLQDGSTLADIDVILFCTGYHYSFPFLDASCQVEISDRVVSPLFKHMIHIDCPRICFIGIPIQICPFPQFDLQVQLFIKTLTGELALPSKAEMLADTENELKNKLSKGVAHKHFHKMGATQWAYNRSLAKMANLTEVPLCVETLYNDVHERRRYHLVDYKKDSFRLSGDSYIREE